MLVGRGLFFGFLFSSFRQVETCELISLIDGLFLAITIFSALGTITTLAGSIIGCLGTCCATNQVRHFTTNSKAVAKDFSD